MPEPLESALNPPERVAQAILQWTATHPACETLAGDLARLVALTLEANRVQNLTGDAEPALFWQRQIADSLDAAVRIEGGSKPWAVGARLLDVGSGGGIPGLVWALLWPAATVTLLESRQKRVHFLEETVQALGIGNVQVLNGRAETWGHDRAHRERYDLVTARALAPMRILAELTVPFVKKGGWLAAIKSADGFAEELRTARSALAQLGSERDATAVHPYTRSDGKACLVCMARKLRPTPQEFPRAEGTPAKRPLG